MTNELAVKVYKVDYDFIIKNYLSPAMWEKEWTLFVYRDVVVTLEISSIHMRPRSINFRIKLRKDEYNTTTSIYYYLDNSNYNVLKKQINGAIEELIHDVEEHFIRQEQGYKDICNAYNNEYDLLHDIAEEFLDENDVINEEIRDVYIDNYIDKNSKTDVYKSNYLQGRKYRNMSDLWLVYYKATENHEKYQYVLNELRNEIGLQAILDDIKESISLFDEDAEDTDERSDYISEMKEALESI